jgi:hypothetical protein
MVINLNAMKNSRISLSVVLLLFIIMFATNPTQSQYEDWIETSIDKQADKQGFLIGGLMKLMSKPTSWLASVTTHREDYILFSVYQTSTPSETIVCIGAFNNFMRIE